MPHALEVPRTRPIAPARTASAPPAAVDRAAAVGAPQPAARPTPAAMAGDVLDLIAGAVAMGMPFLLLSMPAIVLFVLFPLMLAAIPAAVAALLAAPPYLLVRAIRRRRRPAR